MVKSKYFLLAGGIISSLISIFHVSLAKKPILYKLDAPGQYAPSSQLAKQSSNVFTIAFISLRTICAIRAVYAFSGASLIRGHPYVV